MAKQYILKHKKNGLEYPVDQATYDRLVQTKHILQYTIVTQGEISAREEYIPAEVKSMSQRIKEESSESKPDTTQPGTTAPEDNTARTKAGGNKNK